MKNRSFLILVLVLLKGSHVFAQDRPFTVPLWKNGAPGFEKLKDRPEEAKDYWVKNIHNPSITCFLASKEKANGAAILICPGGGHRLLVFNAEGIEPAKYLNSLGISVFVLKYRLAREENSPYKIEIHAREDGERAMRLIRSRAKEWNLDTSRIGMMGFSAGGEVVDMVAFQNWYSKARNPDSINRLSCRPNFIIQIYPGPLWVPDSIAPHSPPAFLLAANDDLCCSPPVVHLLDAYRKAKIPVETHIYNQGGHGFNMGYRSKLQSIHSWPQRLADWLQDSGYLNASP
jgi:acetyl esterase/lipase